MAIPINYQQPPHVAEKPPIVQFVTREDVLWNRPIFRAPPLRVSPPTVDPQAFSFAPKLSPESTQR